MDVVMRAARKIRVSDVDDIGAAVLSRDLTK